MPPNKSRKPLAKQRSRKKNGKNRQANLLRRQSLDRPLAGPGQQGAASSPPRAKVSSVAIGAMADRYRYVGAELRRIAIIAGAMLAILIILAFILN